MEDEIKLKNRDPLKIDKPSICPHCNKGIDPKILNWFPFKIAEEPLICVCFQCPICRQIFFAYYAFDDGFLPLPASYWNGYRHPLQIVGGHGLKKEFSKEINRISPDFVVIYNDAYKAEQSECKSIVGISYRLSFEHLVKHYCLWMFPDKREEILKKWLSQCINDYFDDDFKEIFSRAAWLGNDFAHCDLKHPECDVDDLKQIIEICVSKIEFKVREKKYIAEIKRK